MSAISKCGYSMSCPFYKMTVGKVTSHESLQQWERNVLNLFCHGSDKHRCRRYHLYHNGPEWPGDALLPVSRDETTGDPK